MMNWKWTKKCNKLEQKLFWISKLCSEIAFFRILCTPTASTVAWFAGTTGSSWLSRNSAIKKRRQRIWKDFWWNETIKMKRKTMKSKGLHGRFRIFRSAVPFVRALIAGDGSVETMLVPIGKARTATLVERRCTVRRHGTRFGQQLGAAFESGQIVEIIASARSPNV